MPQRLVTVACNQCAAPLRVPEDATFVTCKHCDAQLAVHQTDSARYTEQLDELKEQTAELADEVRQLKGNRELNWLAHRWKRRRADLGIKLGDGPRFIPTKATAWCIAGVAVVLGASSILTGLLGSGSPQLIGGGALALCLGLGLAGYVFYKAAEYDRAYQLYRHQRRNVDRRHDADPTTPENLP